LRQIAEDPARAVADWGTANWSSKLKYLLRNPRKFWGKGKEKMTKLTIIDEDEPMPVKEFKKMMKGTDRKEIKQRFKRLLPLTFSAKQLDSFLRKALGFKGRLVDDDVETAKLTASDKGFWTTEYRTNGGFYGPMETVVADWEDLEGAGKKKNFEHQLATIMYSPMTYIRDVRKKAKAAGYDPDMVGFSEDGSHKLEIHTPDGRTVRFGRVGYGDHLIWKHLEKRGEAPKGVSQMKRRVFRLSHSAIRGNWKSDKFSPNNLALAILW
jgi:hypothetical protein